MQPKLLLCGCGWLGQYAAQRLNKAFAITGTTRSEAKISQLQGNGVTPLYFQLGDSPSALYEAAHNSVLILNIPPGRRNHDLTDYTRHLCELISALDKDAPPAFVIFISTTSVYGNKNGVITETSHTLPVTESAKAHVRIEQHLLKTVPIHSCVLRLAGLVGNDRHPVNTLAGRTLSGANQVVNLVHIDDVIQVISAIIHQRPAEQIWHLCSQLHPRRGEYYPRMARRRKLNAITFNDNLLAQSQWEGKCIDATDTLDKLGVTLRYPSPWDM